MTREEIQAVIDEGGFLLCIYAEKFIIRPRIIDMDFIFCDTYYEDGQEVQNDRWSYSVIIREATAEEIEKYVK